MPSVFNPDVAKAVAKAVRDAALAGGAAVATPTPMGDDEDPLGTDALG